LLGLIAVSLAIALPLALRNSGGGGGGNPDGPLPPVFNPYVLSGSNTSNFGKQVYTLSVDKSRSNFYVKVPQTYNNQLASKVSVTSNLMQYGSLRIKVENQNTLTSSSTNSNILEQFLSQEYLNAYNQGLNNNEMGFSVESSSKISLE